MMSPVSVNVDVVYALKQNFSEKNHSNRVTVVFYRRWLLCRRQQGTIEFIVHNVRRKVDERRHRGRLPQGTKQKINKRQVQYKLI